MNTLCKENRYAIKVYRFDLRYFEMENLLLNCVYLFACFIPTQAVYLCPDNGYSSIGVIYVNLYYYETEPYIYMKNGKVDGILSKIINRMESKCYLNISLHKVDEKLVRKFIFNEKYTKKDINDMQKIM